MKKRFLSLLLAVVMVVSLVPVTTLSATAEGVTQPETVSVTKTLTGVTTTVGDTVNKNEALTVDWDYGYYGLDTLETGSITIENSNGVEVNTTIGIKGLFGGSAKGFTTSFVPNDNATVATIHPTKCVVSAGPEATDGSLYSTTQSIIRKNDTKFSFGFWVKDSGVMQNSISNSRMEVWPAYFASNSTVSGTARLSIFWLYLHRLVGSENVGCSIPASVATNTAFSYTSASATNLANVDGWSYIVLNIDGIVYSDDIKPNAANTSYVTFNSYTSNMISSQVPFEFAGVSMVFGELRTSPYQVFPTTAGGDLTYNLNGYKGDSIEIPASCVTGDIEINLTQTVAPELKILMIGNSHTQDGKEYLDEIAASYGYNVNNGKLVIGDVNYGGRTVGYWANCVRNEVNIDDNAEALTKYGNYDTTSSLNMKSASTDPRENTITFSVYQNGAWHSASTTVTTIAGAVNYEDWDVVLIQGYSSELSDAAYHLDTNLKAVVDYIDFVKPGLTKAFYLSWIGGGVGTAANQTDLTARWNIMSNAVADKVDFIIPAATTIENLRTTYLKDLAYKADMGTDGCSSNDIQKGLTRDTNHVSLVLGRYAAGITIFDTIAQNMMPGLLAHRNEITSVYPHYASEIAAIGELPEEYMQMIYDAADAARANPTTITNLTATPYTYPAVDPAVSAQTAIGALNGGLCVDDVSTEDAIKTGINALATLVGKNAITADQGEDIKISTDLTSYDSTTTAYAATVTVQYGYTFKTVELAGNISEAVATIGGVKYPSVNAAISAATNGQTIQLVAEETANITLSDGKNLVLDLNGNNITTTGAAITVTNGTLTINGNGTINGEASAISANGADAFVYINAGTYRTGTSGTVVTVANEATVSAKGGTFCNYDPTPICAFDYGATENAGEYTVAPLFVNELSGDNVVTSLSLLDNININFKVVNNADNDVSAYTGWKLVVDDGKGHVTEVTDWHYDNDNGRIWCQLEVLAANINTAYSVHYEAKNELGQDVHGETFTFGVGIYCNAMKADPSSSNEFVALCNSIIAYGTAAANYLNSLS